MSTVFMVIDFQKGVVEGAANVENVTANIVSLIAKARAEGAPIVFVQHNDEELERLSPEWSLVEALDVRDGDPIVEKTFTDSFAGTNLDEVLHSLGATHLMISGAQSNWCVNAACRSALVHGYDVTLVADAHTTSDVPLESGTITGQQVIDYTNLHVHWLDYPGRTVTTAKAAEISFS
jgi:nicotinamidase-related amidase